MNKKIAILIASLITIPATAFAIDTVHRTNKVKIGDATATDKVIEFDTGDGSANMKLKANKTAGKVQFSHDGTNFKDIGSGAGGGGGLNMLSDYNADMEAGTTNWTASGGTLTAVDNFVANGGKSLSWDSSALGQTLYSAQVPLNTASFQRLSGGDCLSGVWYNTASADEYKLKVIDNGSIVLAEANLPASPGNKWTFGYVTYQCPEAVDAKLFKTGVESLVADAAVIYLDDAYQGEHALIEVSQSDLYGYLKYPAIALCTGWSGNWTSFSDFPADADCVAASPIGNVTAPAGGLPQVNADAAPAGRYAVSASFMMTAGTVGARVACVLKDGDGTILDGTGYTAGNIDGGTAGIRYPMQLEGAVQYANSGNRLFKVQCRNTSGTTGFSMENDLDGLTFTVKRYPTGTEKAALTPDAAKWKVDAIVSNGGGTSLGTADVTVWTTPSDTDLSLRTFPGSSGAQIACAGTEEASGTTCAGSEHYGVAFTIPRPGDYEACFTINSRILVGNNATSRLIYQLGETANNSTSFASDMDTEHGPLSYHLMGDGAGGNANENTIPAQVCREFSWTSSGKKTVRVAFKHDTPGTNAPSALDVFGASRVTVRPTARQQAAWILVNSVVNPRAGVSNVCTGYISNAGTPSVSRDDGCISSVSLVSTGIVQINFNAGTFNSTPNCFAEPGISSNRASQVHNMTASSIRVEMRTLDNIATDTPFGFGCVGGK